MPLPAWLVNPALHGITRILCRIDASQMSQIPASGPLILAANHINFLEIPILYTRLASRPMTVFAKVETWDSRLNQLLFPLSRAIPVRRGESDLGAMRRAMDELKAGRILAIAPEGTRSGTGRLQRGHPGIASIALRSGAPILPMAYYGSEAFAQNLRRMRRTDFNVVVGQPFRLDARGVGVTHGVRQQMTDEIMYRIAALLPPSYRGCYSDLDHATQTYLDFSAP